MFTLRPPRHRRAAARLSARLLSLGLCRRHLLAVAVVRSEFSRSGRPELPRPSAGCGTGEPVSPGPGIPAIRQAAGIDPADPPPDLRHDAADPALAARHAPGHS